MRTLLAPIFCTLLCGITLIASSIIAADSSAPVKIVLVGDSTVASKSGWGDAFADLVTPQLECINLGRGGRSSKSFRSEGHWEKALAAKPDWIFIQFGHNDQPGKGLERETDPNTTFRENLTRYVVEARAAGAKPVLITSLARRTYDDEGKIVSRASSAVDETTGETRSASLDDYATATRAVAAAEKVPLLDLHARSIAQLNKLGPEKAAVYNPESKNPERPDLTHLSAKGAEESAKLVLDEIRKNIPELPLP